MEVLQTSALGRLATVAIVVKVKTSGKARPVLTFVDVIANPDGKSGRNGYVHHCVTSSFSFPTKIEGEIATEECIVTNIVVRKP